MKPFTRYFMQAPGGEPIEWPSGKPLDCYFATIEELFYLTEWQARRALAASVLTHPNGARFWALDARRPVGTIQ